MPAQHVQATSLDRDKACALTASTAEPPEDDEGGSDNFTPSFTPQGLRQSSTWLECGPFSCSRCGFVSMMNRYRKWSETFTNYSEKKERPRVRCVDDPRPAQASASHCIGLVRSHLTPCVPPCWGDVSERHLAGTGLQDKETPHTPRRGYSPKSRPSMKEKKRPDKRLLSIFEFTFLGNY